MKKTSTEKSIDKITNGFYELIKNESPEFALGILESLKMAYTMVMMHDINNKDKKK